MVHSYLSCDKCTQWCNHHNEELHHLRKFPQTPSWTTPSFPPPIPRPECHINGAMQYAALSLASFTYIVCLRFIYVVY